MSADVIATANRIGHETALGDLHCLRGSLLLEQERYVEAERSSSGGWTHPMRVRAGVSGPSTCSGAACRVPPRAPDEKNLQAALATLRELGVEVLPHRLGHWVA